MNKKRIAFVTTARSDYSTMYPVMALAQSDTDIESVIFCGGMHLKPEFGETWKQLETDGLKISEKVDFFEGSSSGLGLATSIARGVAVFAEALSRQKIEMIVVSGDRAENLALYSAATALSIPICHLCGGDITEGALDNQIRHMMTKLSHLHMVSMPEHWQRVIQMGEEPWRVHITGDAALDTLRYFKPLSRKQLKQKEGIPDDGRLIISTFHPVTLADDDFRSQFRCLLTFLSQRSEIPVITYPNIDPGYEPLIEMLEAFSVCRPDAILKKSFTREGYYSMLSHAEFMVGNSSSGIWEAPSFKLPVINVGNRQAGRKRSENVIDIPGTTVEEYEAAAARFSEKDFSHILSRCENPYGDGLASEKTLTIIKNTPIDARLRVKKFFEIPMVEIEENLLQETERG